MGFKSFLQNLFGGKKQEDTIAIEAPKVETSPTKIIEDRLAEIAAEKKVEEEKKVTAKDIKAKVKRTPDTDTKPAQPKKAENKPAQPKAPAQKQPQKQNPPRKKAENKPVTKK